MKPTEEDLKQDLSRVIKSEGYKSDKGSLELIALLAEGSYRDALTILEKILAISSNKVIEVSEVEVVTGAPKSELVETFLTAILAGNAGEALTILAKARENNLDMKVFTKLVLRSAREYMFAALAPELATTKRRELSPEHIKKIPNILRAFLSAYNDISYAYIPSLPLELAVIDLCQ